MTVFPPCASCARFDRKTMSLEPVCEAFPKGIPEEIWLEAKNTHRQPYPGDNGKTWIPVEGWDPEMM